MKIQRNIQSIRLEVSPLPMVVDNKPQFFNTFNFIITPIKIDYDTQVIKSRLNETRKLVHCTDIAPEKKKNQRNFGK